MDDSSDDRRKWKRLDHGFRVELQVHGSSGRTIQALGTHLSPEGLFVQLADPPPTDTKVRVTIGKGDKESVQMAAEGVVVNQVAPTDALDIIGIGIELTDAGAPWRKLYEWLSD